MTLTQYITQVREEWFNAVTVNGRKAEEPLVKIADFWEAKIRERETALRGEIEGEIAKIEEASLADSYSESPNIIERKAVLTAIARIFDGDIIQDKR